MGSIIAPPTYRGRLFPRVEDSLLGGPFTAAEIATMVANNGLSALYDTAVSSSVILSGGDVVTIQDQTPFARHPTQPAPANRPQYTGAPIVHGWNSIAFTPANLDRLEVAGNAIGGGAATMICVAQPIANAMQFWFGNVASSGLTGWSLGGRLSPICRDSLAPGVFVRQSAVGPSLVAPEVWIVRDRPGAPALSRLMVNGVNVPISNSASIHLDPGALGLITIGSLFGPNSNANARFFFGAMFTTEIDDALALSITNRLLARLGLPPAPPPVALPPVTNGLVVYLRADVGVTGTAAVSRWADQFNVDDVTAAGGVQPALVTGLDGRPGITMTGTQRLSNALPISAQPLTIVSACDTHGAIPASEWTLLDGSASRCEVRYRSATTASMYAGLGPIQTPAQPSLLDRNLVRTDVFDGAASIMRINGVQVLAGNPGALALTGLVVGNEVVFGRPFGGSIRSILIYNRRLTPAEITQTEAFMADLWGQT